MAESRSQPERARREGELGARSNKAAVQLTIQERVTTADPYKAVGKRSIAKSAKRVQVSSELE